MPTLTKKKMVVARKKSPIETRVAKMIVDMAFDGMKDLPEEEQKRRATKFCEALDARRRPASKAS